MGELYPETKVIYHIDDEETPYMIRLPVGSDQVCLGDFKIALKHPNCKFFFKSMDDDFGVVKEEIIDDNAKLPCINGKVVSWLVTAEGSGHSDSNSHCTDATPNANKIGGENRPPSFHGTNRMISPEGNANVDQSACTSETESTISGLPRFPRHGSKLDRRAYRRQYEVRRGVPHRGGMEISSALTSDLETTSFYESEDGRASRVSSSTDITSVSRMVARQKRKRRRQKPAISRTSSFSSITESSMSLNVITVTLNMDTVNFLGISIVGHSNTGGDGGIYVGSIMKGGAVALDGRIEPGDMILQVNEVSFENMNNDDAVRVLRESVQRPGPIKLVVAKNWDPQPKGYFTIPRTEPVRPIDPGAWVAHTNAMRQEMLPDFPCRPSSAATYVTNTGESLGSSIPETEKYLDEIVKLDVNTNDMTTIIMAMKRPDSGLEVRERMWLKISIPNAFIGAEVVDWLYTNVLGFSDRREARKYAARLLKEGFIRHTVNKITFSEQCYYVFGDLCSDFATLRLSHSGPKPPSDSAQSDCGETVAPLPPPGPTPPTPTPWGAPYPPSFASSYNPLPLSGFRPTFNSQIGGNTGSDPFGTLTSAGNLPPTARSEANSNGSGGSGGSSGSEQRRRGPPLVGTLPKPPGIPASAAGSSSIVPPPRGLNAVPTDLTTSKQSFALAMNNPHEFFVDVM